MKSQQGQDHLTDQSNQLLSFKTKIQKDFKNKQIFEKKIILIAILITVFTIILISINLFRDNKECTHPSLDKIITKMTHRPHNKMLEPHQEYRQYHRATPQAYFGYRLMQFPENKEYLAAQLYLYDKKYGIGEIKKQQQLSLCIISTGYNIKSKQNRIQTYFDSIFRQNYSNYNIVYIDDASPDGTTAYAKQYVRNKYPKQFNKVTFILNQIKTQALHNKINGIQNYCKSGQIVIDIDSDDALIGKQVFNLIHKGYKQSNQTWLLYTSHIFYHPQFKQPLQGSSDTLSPVMLQSSKQRLMGNFTIMHLRTFRRQIFMKIPQSYWRNQSGNHYQWISDGWIYSAIAQLSGFSRIKFINQVTYFYFRQSQQFNRKQKKQGTLLMRFARPFQRLSTQQSQVKNIKNYQITDKQQNKVRKKYQNAYKQIEKQQFIENIQFQEDINDMKKIPKLISQNPTKNQGITDNSMFYSRIMSSPHNNDYNKALKYYYNKKYQMHKTEKQTSICIYSKGKTSFENGFGFANFIQSINRQNYQNFVIIFVEFSEQHRNSTIFQQYVVNQTPRLIHKLKIQFEKQGHSLQTKYKLINQYCKTDSIIVQMDPNHQLVGKLSFKLINSLYQKHPDKQIMFFSYYYLNNNGFPIQSKLSLQIQDTKFNRRTYSQKMEGVLSYRNRLFKNIQFKFWAEGDKYLEQNKKYYNLFGLMQSVILDQFYICEQIIAYQLRQTLNQKITLRSEKQLQQIKNKQPLNVLQNFR